MTGMNEKVLKNLEMKTEKLFKRKLVLGREEVIDEQQPAITSYIKSSLILTSLSL